MREVKSFIPYGHQTIDKDDINAVTEALTSPYLTGGKAVEKFEEDICRYVGARHGVAVSNGTAALHAAMFALGIGKGDEVITTPMTFAASSNCVLYQGGKPIFADVNPETLLLDPEKAAAAITPQTKAIIAVDYAGQPCDWDALRELANRHNLALVADCCHALGAEYKGQRAGSLADISVFSFHPVKHITTGEGGIAVANDKALAARMRAFRSHGIATTAAQRDKSDAWFYQMENLGFNYRITDFQCALGSSQLKKLDEWILKRAAIADIYNDAFSNNEYVRPLTTRPDVLHAWHLYVIRAQRRDELFRKLRANGIGANVHYIPVYLHPYYQRLGYEKGLCPVAEESYSEIISLPIWPGLEKADARRVINSVLEFYR